jgi:prolyl-tRNA editing enzyme YbaK/EbsC (Cys-tRNA(Pro) deacylase)
VLVGEPVACADADFVRDMTGVAIGGVPPVGHRVTPRTIIDADLLRLDTIWAATVTPNAVFRLSPSQLDSLTGGRPRQIAIR